MELPGGRRGNRGWVGARSRVGWVGVFPVGAALQRNLKHSSVTSFYQLYLRPTLRSLSHTLEAELSPVGWKQKRNNHMNEKQNNPPKVWMYCNSMYKQSVHSILACRYGQDNTTHRCSGSSTYESIFKSNACMLAYSALTSICYICFLLLITVTTSDVCCKHKSFTKGIQQFEM